MRSPSDRDLLQTIDDEGKGLSKWEIDRLSEWIDLLAGGGFLSTKQRAVAERIHRERVLGEARPPRW